MRYSRRSPVLLASVGSHPPQPCTWREVLLLVHDFLWIVFVKPSLDNELISMAHWGLYDQENTILVTRRKASRVLQTSSQLAGQRQERLLWNVSTSTVRFISLLNFRGLGYATMNPDSIAAGN